MADKTVVVRYVANNRDMARLLMSDQTQDLADQGAQAGVTYARLYAAGARPKLPASYIAGFKAVAGPPVVLDRNPRRTARVVNEDRIAAAIEFGSGIRSGGNDGRGRARPQGGYSDPHRVLGRAGARLGSAPLRKKR